MPWGLPVLTAPLRAPQHGRCVFAGWQGSNPCCSRPEVLVGGACAARAAALHRCFRSLQSVPVCTVIAGFRVCAFNLLPPASDPPRPSQSPLTCLSHILFSLFRFCFFVSEFSHFAYNSCPSYFLPVPRNTISLPPAPSLSFISRLLSVLLPPCPLD